MSDADEHAQFERVDWAEIDRSKQLLTAERASLLVGLVLLFGLFLYDYYVAHVYLVGTWMVEWVDWVILLGVVLLVAYGAVPAIKSRDSVGRIIRRAASRRLTAAAGLFLLLFVLAGAIGPAVFPNPGLRFEHGFHPPLGFESTVVPVECLGELSGEAFEETCAGTAEYPLGTNERGHPMTFLLAAGARVALYVVVFTTAFVVPLAVAVGVIAGLRGGLVDDLLMSYVDIQLSIPAIVVYFIGYSYYNTSLLLLLVAFGLFSWGGIARLVRSEVLQRREDGYVLVARSLGGSWSYIARRHILPNSTNTVLPAVFQLLALLVLVEAGIAFLGFHDIELYSWGSTISESVNADVPPQILSRAPYPAYQIWWVSTLPALALTGVIVSFKLVGDGLRDALDPRRD